jgi:hypothetical protein
MQRGTRRHLGEHGVHALHGDARCAAVKLRLLQTPVELVQCGERREVEVALLL